DLAIEVAVRNPGPASICLNTLTFQYSAAVLEVQTADGTPVAPIPPSLPPIDDGLTGRIELVPGAEASFNYSGASLFDAPLPRGRYAIRFRVMLVEGPSGRNWAGTLVSDWVSFSILGE
ncbi:MAG: hypothetical protein MUF20_01820, partial [Methylotetracoccus sp.]|nr:hypothetical protein [Methylotetracoccus sp.]